MIAEFHLIWTAYGWWLPNDPRGSSSHEIRVERVAELGELHYGRKTVQPPGREVREFYDKAKDVLQHQLLRFDAIDVAIIRKAFGETINRKRYTCYACSIMGDHVHALIRKHKHHGEAMIENLQDASKAGLIKANRCPTEHPVWGRPGRKRFLYTHDDIRRIINYINHNPIKLGQHPQHWDFVKQYDGWMPGNSGAKR